MARTPGGTLSAFTLLSTPDAPTITSISTSIGSASVAFTAPTDTGDGAISSYVVTAVDESSGASTGATGASSPITVSPPAGGTFKIRMQALNPYGPGRLTEYDTGNAIYSGAELYAWGRNTHGSVGDNTTVNRSSPVQIGALLTWSQVAAGEWHTASVKTDNTLWVWGRNNHGQIGDGTIVSRSSPVQIGALTTWYQVAAGNYHTAAVKTDGTLWSWGRNFFGRLGDNTTINRSSPIQVGALTNWSQVTAGDYNTAAIKTDGTLWSWGLNNSGQVGDGTAVSRSSPVQIGALTNWSKVAAGFTHSISVKTDGTLWGWGGNTTGQLGVGNTISRSSPVQVGALTTWAKVAYGSRNDHSAAIKTDNTLWLWGYNNNGQLGDNTVANKSSPVQIGLLAWSSVSTGSRFTSAVKFDDTLWSWGENDAGQLGLNILTTDKRSSPVQVGALTNWYEVSSGSAHTIALLGVV